MDKPVYDRRWWQRLADSKPTGETVEVEVLLSWFDSRWPKMVEYVEESKARRPNLKLRIANWWSNVTPEEIAKARERLRVIDTGGEAVPQREGAGDTAARMARRLRSPQRAASASPPPLRLVGD